MSASGGAIYQWTGPNSFSAPGPRSPSPMQRLINSGKYYVTVTNADNCSKLDSVIAMVNISPVATTPFPEARICEGDNVMSEVVAAIRRMDTCNRSIIGNYFQPGSETDGYDCI